MPARADGISEDASPRPVVAAIVGPTACGKSRVAIELAHRLDAEIISVDSMQVYRGLDAGTAKPSAEEQGAVRHHLIDILDPSETFSAHEFRQLALRAIEDVTERGRVPLLVGGTGLYFSALTTPATLAPSDDGLRAEIEARLLSDGLETLVIELTHSAPKIAAEIDLANPRRVVRALEIAMLQSGGRTTPSFDGYGSGPAGRAHASGSGMPVELVAAAISLPIALLYQRIEARCDKMIDQGLADEVRMIFAPEAGRPVDSSAAGGLSTTAAQALGYKEVAEALALGDPPEAAIPAIVSRTRQLARRQRAWFRRDPRIAWFSSCDGSGLAEAIGSYLSRGLGRLREGRLEEPTATFAPGDVPELQVRKEAV